MAEEFIPYDGPIVTRKEAQDLGLKRYFTGKSCPAGHVVERAVSSRCCILCMRANTIKWEKANPDKVKASAFKRYHADPDGERERTKLWCSCNKERISFNNKAFRINNPGVVQAAEKRWRLGNPEKVRVIQRRRTVRRHAAEGEHTAEQVTELLAIQRFKCAYCKAKIVKKRYEADHIQPLALGGSDWISNIQILCPDCNRKKGMKDPIVWARAIGLLL